MEKVEHTMSLADIDPIAFLQRYKVDFMGIELTPAILDEFKSALGVFAESIEEMPEDDLKLYIALWQAIIEDEKEHTHRVQDIYDASTGKTGLHNVAEAIEELLGWLNKPHVLSYESTHL